jgi:hypothetical protein
MRSDTEDILTTRSCIIDFIILIAGFNSGEVTNPEMQGSGDLGESMTMNQDKYQCLHPAPKDFKYMKALYHF